MNIVKTIYSPHSERTSRIDECFASLSKAIASGDAGALKLALEQKYIFSVERLEKLDFSHHYAINYADILECLIVCETSSFIKLFKQLIDKQNEQCAEVFLERMNQTQLKILTSEWKNDGIQQAITAMSEAGRHLSSSQSDASKQEGKEISKAAAIIDENFKKIIPQQDDKATPHQKLVSAELKFNLLSTLKTQKAALRKYRTAGPYIANILVCICTGIIPYIMACMVKELVTGRSSCAVFSVSTQGEKSIREIHSVIDDRKREENECRVSSHLMDRW